MTLTLDGLLEICGKATPGKWRQIEGLGIWAPSARGGETKILDVRGWGYLTGLGHGALGLPEDQAIAIQEANGELAALGPTVVSALLRVAKAADAIVANGMSGERFAKLEAAQAALHTALGE